MSFNYEKRKVMHFGRRNAEHEYISWSKMNDIKKCLMISKNLKWISQIRKATRSAKAIIDKIKNSFSYFASELVRLLYISVIRPQLAGIE